MSVTSGTKRKEGGLSETVRVVFHALIIALVIRTFLFQPFNIPSGSMKATLLVGDYLFVSKYSYGYSKYSLPLSPPIFNGLGAAFRLGALGVGEDAAKKSFAMPLDGLADAPRIDDVGAEADDHGTAPRRIMRRPFFVRGPSPRA